MSTPEAADRIRMQPALFHAAEAACTYHLTDGFCTPKNVARCRCWDAAAAVMKATGLSALAVAWIFRNTAAIESAAIRAEAGEPGDQK